MNGEKLYLLLMDGGMETYAQSELGKARRNGENSFESERQYYIALTGWSLTQISQPIKGMKKHSLSSK